MSSGIIQLAAVELSVMDNSKFEFDGIMENRKDPRIYRELSLEDAHSSDESVCKLTVLLLQSFFVFKNFI